MNDELKGEIEDRDAGPFKATDSGSVCYGIQMAVSSLQVVVTPGESIVLWCSS
jgi:hypothetical protein